MTENRKNWLYPEASGLYFPHDGFVMRATDGKQYDIDEECELLNELNDINQELYDFRLVLNALLFNEWAENKKYEVYKSKRHSDGSLCFDGEWFVVVAILPTGQVTNHYHVKYWDYFKIPSYEKVKDEFDGHTSTDVLIRYGLMFND